MGYGLSKRERLCSQKAVETLVASGHYACCGPLKCRYFRREENPDGMCRILVSVPKRFFKRAVKRNLLKRRIREAYRLQKDLLSESNDIDMMFVYSSRDIAPFREIASSLHQILETVRERA